MTTMPPGNDADHTPPHLQGAGTMLGKWLTRTPGRELAGTVQEVTDRNGTITSLGPSHTYRLGQVIGQGGQAAVAAATPVGADRGPLVARVELNPRDPRDWRRRELLLFLAHLSRVTPATYPALIRVTESFVTYVHPSELHDQQRFDSHAGNEPLWVDVMERCTTLADHMRATHPNGYDPLEGAKLAVPLLRTLGVLHDHFQLVHRDIDEGNVLVAPDATLRIADWGVVVPMSGASPYTYTATFGKRHTMPPETRDGDQKIGHHTDAWQAGRLLGVILTGTSPFLNDGTTLNSPRLATLPRELRAIIEGLTNPHVGARLGTYDAATLLEKFIGYPVTTPTSLRGGRRRTALIGIAALVLISGVGTLAALTRPDGQSNAASTPTPLATSSPATSPASTPTNTPTATPTDAQPVALTDGILTYPDIPTVRWTASSLKGETLGDDVTFADPRVPWELMGLPVYVSPVDAGEVWIAAASPGLVGLDPDTGDRLWTYRPAAGDLDRCSGDLVDGNIACTVSDDWTTRSAIVLLDVHSGAETSRFNLPFPSRAFEVTGSDIVSIMYTGSNPRPYDDPQSLPENPYRVSRYTADGTEVWTTDIPYVWDGFVCGECSEATATVNPSLVDAVIMGQHFLLDLNTGALVFHGWGSDPSTSTLTHDGAVISSTTGDTGTPPEVTLLGGDGSTIATLPDHVLLSSADDQPLLLMDTDGQVVELDPAAGATTPTGVTWPTDAYPPTASRNGDLLLLEGSRTLEADWTTYAYDLRRPENPIWQTRESLTQGPFGPVASSDGTLLYSLVDEKVADSIWSASVTATRVSDGALLWTLPLGQYDTSTSDQILPRLGTAGGHLLIVSGPTMTVLQP